MFDDRNAFLDVLLGLISLSERTVASVADLADPAPATSTDPARPLRGEGPLLR